MFLKLLFLNLKQIYCFSSDYLRNLFHIYHKRFCSSHLFHLSLILKKLTACFISDCSSSKSSSSTSLYLSFLELEFISFAISFQNQVLDYASSSLLSVVLSLSLSISSCMKVREELASNLLF